MILFAHAAYRLGDALSARGSGLAFNEVRDAEALRGALAEAETLVVSGLWRNEYLDLAPKLRFVQAISAGTDLFDREKFRARGVRLASAQGANERAVADHAMALILALARRIPEARDNQARKVWRGMMSQRAEREQELGALTLAIVGFGRIGQRLAKLARAFDMRVIGVRRNPEPVEGVEVVVTARLAEALREADFVALTCPLTPETQGLMDAAALAAMKPTAHLVNVARGKVVDEPALIAALEAGRIAGAALDVTVEEPLPAASPLWTFPNVLVTPHSAGETRIYEDNVLEILLDNLGRLERGETSLRNEIV